MTHHQARAAYLETEVSTATPQKLRLMLIEGAIRFASSALEHWNHENDELADTALAKARAILAELQASVKADASTLARDTAALYAFLFTTLVDAHQQRDQPKLKEVLDILAVERETWEQLCRAMPDSPSGHTWGKSSEITTGSSADYAEQSQRSRQAPGDSDVSFEA